jgi:hypothetical protein
MKNNAYILNIDLLNEQNLSIEEFLTLLSLKNKIDYDVKDETIETLQEKLYLKLIKNENIVEEIIFREKGNIIIELTTIEGIRSIKEKKIIKRSDRAINQELEDFVEEYRNLWKGLKPGSMGSLNGCKEKLIRWMKENPNYSKENILNAAKIYLNTLENYKFLQQADYFIYKKDVYGESSRLSAFIDEDQTIEEGWSSNLK